MLIEYFTQWLENRGFISPVRQESVEPDVIESSTNYTPKTLTHKVVIPEKFKGDIRTLLDFIGQDTDSACFSDLCITITLQEILTLLPRNRRRIDSYTPLVRYLQDEMGITLKIISQKSK